ncbi:MAG: hypothetical protein Q9163_001674 [Psora crenata]
MSDHRPKVDDVSDWEVEEGLPQFQDQFIQQYLNGREALIEQEKSQRSDHAFRQSMTPMATEACTIVSRILAEEQRTLWTRKLSQDRIKKHSFTIYPGMPFSLARDTMERTKSWQIIKRLPKGALLHAHIDFTMDIGFLIDQALGTEGMAMSASQALVETKDWQAAKIQFRFRKSILDPGASIWAASYQPLQFVSMKEAADSFPNGGREGFKSWLANICTITGEDTLKHYHGVDAIWQKFDNCFLPLNSLENYEPVFRPAVRRLVRDLALDGISWVDFRYFATDFFLEGAEEPSPDHADFLRIWSEEVEAFRASEEGKDFWGCRLIWTSLRFWGKKQIIEHMKACIEMKKQFPDLICGYDVVGQEDAGRPLADLIPELFWFKKRCVENGVDIPFFFHAGECLGDGDATDQNLFDAVLLGTRRIGHGFSLYKHPLLIEMVKTKKILIESCPISNEALRLISSIKSHPLPALLSRGVPCALSNDDPSFLGYGTSGVTHDFWQALQGWDNLGLGGLGSLAENSVRWACYLPDQGAKVWSKDVADGKYGQGIRAKRMREWTEQWNKFCEWIVLEYAIDYGGDEDK